VRLLQREGAAPVVYGFLGGRKARRTILIYAHYDGQPVDPQQWQTDPWKPAILDDAPDAGGKAVSKEIAATKDTAEWRIAARSAADDKAPIIAVLAAVDFLKMRRTTLSVNIKFLFEGEEETGSPNLPAILDEHRELLKADAMLLCDGPVHQNRKPQLLFGARGMAEVEMIVFGPNRPLHSGHYGNWAPNPIALLIELLGRMRDSEGKILIPGFYDDVRPLSSAERSALAEIPSVDAPLRQEYGLAWSEAGNALLNERILQPALNFRGLEAGHTGGQAANAIPAEARASIDFRLVPNQTPERVRRLVENFIANQGFHIIYTPPDPQTRFAHPRLILLQWGPGYLPSRTAMDIPFSRAVIQALEKGLGSPIIKQPSVGGSIPMQLFADKLNLPVIVLPIANHDNRQHGPDENLRLQNLLDGIKIFAILLADLGSNWK
jgi:acetylornithine deacetylase/succinyl-diaminopimelate desuccinylase-like protein